MGTTSAGTATSRDKWIVERQGRLVLARPHRLPDLATANAYRNALVAAMQSEPGGAIICADCRFGAVMPKVAADVLTDLVTRRGALLIRSAILLHDPPGVFDLQVERLVREGGHPHRRTFREIGKLLDYLGEVLDRGEVVVARRFLLWTEQQLGAPPSAQKGELSKK